MIGYGRLPVAAAAAAVAAIADALEATRRDGTSRTHGAAALDGTSRTQGAAANDAARAR